MNFSFNPLNDYTSTPKLKLRKSTSQALLSSVISIPRVGRYQCDQCGHRVTRMCSYDEPYQSNSQGRHRLRRPHSFDADSHKFVEFHKKVKQKLLLPVCEVVFLWVIIRIVCYRRCINVKTQSAPILKAVQKTSTRVVHRCVHALHVSKFKIQFLLKA